jgi:hypothetical protein
LGPEASHVPRLWESSALGVALSLKSGAVFSHDMIPFGIAAHPEALMPIREPLPEPASAGIYSQGTAMPEERYEEQAGLSLAALAEAKRHATRAADRRA